MLATNYASLTSTPDSPLRNVVLPKRLFVSRFALTPARMTSWTMLRVNWDICRHRLLVLSYRATTILAESSRHSKLPIHITWRDWIISRFGLPAFPSKIFSANSPCEFLEVLPESLSQLMRVSLYYKMWGGLRTKLADSRLSAMAYLYIWSLTQF